MEAPLQIFRPQLPPLEAILEAFLRVWEAHWKQFSYRLGAFGADYCLFQATLEAYLFPLEAFLMGALEGIFLPTRRLRRHCLGKQHWRHLNCSPFPIQSIFGVSCFGFLEGIFLLNRGLRYQSLGILLNTITFWCAVKTKSKRNEKILEWQASRNGSTKKDDQPRNILLVRSENQGKAAKIIGAQ